MIWRRGWGRVGFLLFPHPVLFPLPRCSGLTHGGQLGEAE